MEIHPEQLSGAWNEGWVLDKHTVSSELIGQDPFGHNQYKTVRTELGETLYRLKYRGQVGRADDIAETAFNFLCERPWFNSVDIILPAPPSTQRAFQPVFLVAQRIAEIARKHYANNALEKVSSQQAKNLSGVQKAQLAGSVNFIQHFIRPCNVLVVDDLYTSGSTLSACVNALRKDPLTQNIYVLAITKTHPR